MVGELGDDHAAVRVSGQDDRAVDLIYDVPHVRGVGGQIPERSRRDGTPMSPSAVCTRGALPRFERVEQGTTDLSVVVGGNDRECDQLGHRIIDLQRPVTSARGDTDERIGSNAPSSAVWLRQHAFKVTSALRDRTRVPQHLQERDDGCGIVRCERTTITTMHRSAATTWQGDGPRHRGLRSSTPSATRRR